MSGDGFWKFSPIFLLTYSLYNPSFEEGKGYNPRFDEEEEIKTAC